jgi:hypothetical protein
MTRALILMGCSLVAGAVPQVHAQDSTAPSVGSRIRVHAPPLVPDTAVGVVLGYASDALTLRRSDTGDTLAVPYTAISCFQVHRVRGHAVQWLVGGALLGGTIGAVNTALGPGCGAHVCTADRKPVVQGMLELGVAGGFLGFIAGTLASTGEWDAVPVSCLHSAEQTADIVKREP